jgi:hypothetical protein
VEGGMLLVHNHSLPQLLANTFPEFNWEIKEFSQNSDIWADRHLANYFVEWLKKQAEKEKSHFLQEIAKNEITSPLIQLLKTEFPLYKWASTSGKKTQYVLKECLGMLFNKENTILLEEYKHPDISNLELDYFFPQYNLAFEYQVINEK